MVLRCCALICTTSIFKVMRQNIKPIFQKILIIPNLLPDTPALSEVAQQNTVESKISTSLNLIVKGTNMGMMKIL
jgi:hypothetical protein